MRKLLIAGLLGATALSAGGLDTRSTAIPGDEAAIRANARSILAQAIEEDDEDDEDVHRDQNHQDDQGDLQDDEEDASWQWVRVGLG
jgi:hypothetical protein